MARIGLVSMSIALTVLSSGVVTAAPRGCLLQGGPERTVTRIVDAVTLGLDDGTVVRLANVAVPPTGEPSGSSTSAEERAKTALTTAVAQRSVRLWFDTARQDRHGITRAHVMMRVEGEDRWLQSMLVEAGHVRVDARHGERACVTALLAPEATARAAGAGVWSSMAFRVRAATPAWDLRLYRGTFQIIQGEVMRVETGRDVMRLVLGQDRRRALSVSVRTNDRDLIGVLGGNVQALVGRRIEARGFLATRPGGAPDIDVSLSGDVRLVP